MRRKGRQRDQRREMLHTNRSTLRYTQRAKVSYTVFITCIVNSQVATKGAAYETTTPRGWLCTGAKAKSLVGLDPGS